MILAQHSDGGSNEGDADRKSPMSGTMASSLRAYTGILSSGFPSNFSQNPMGIFSSSGIRSYGGMDSTSITTSSGLHEALSSSNIPGIPGLAPTSGVHGDVRSSFEQRRRQYFGTIDTDLKGHSDDFNVKLENDICGTDRHGPRIGLNLGVRTYFSTEDTAAGRLGKRHRASSPGSQVPMCQAEGCKADLSMAKHYHRRHKVCEQHSKAANVIAAGHTQRFCQQCSRLVDSHIHFLIGTFHETVLASLHLNYSVCTSCLLLDPSGCVTFQSLRMRSISRVHCTSSPL